MRFKLIITLVETSRSDVVLAAGRAAGATGATIINFARNEDVALPGLFRGWDLGGNRHLVLFVARSDFCRSILEEIGRAGEFDTEPGAGLVVQLNVEDAVGIERQWLELAASDPPQ